MSLELGVAIIALLVSLVSFEVNRRAAAAAERHGRMPILNPQPYQESDGGRAAGRLLVRNIGNGPALNIVLADATGELATEDLRLIRLSPSKHRDHWKNYRHLRPIPSGGERRYSWDYKGAIGFSYTDALGSTYTLLTSPYGTKVVDGAVMQHEPLNKLRYLEEL
jgi:hypothetical protein